ncbi:MAG: hypothetical protein ACI8WB_005063 [Phenylobacterium sp.]|jgi:hypothetical protein
MKPFPDSAILLVAKKTADQLLKAAEQLTEYANSDFYDPAIQLHVHDHIRGRCGQAFDDLLHQVKTILQQPPYSVLIQGLTFDQHYRVFVALNRALGLLVARPFDAKSPRAQLIHHVEPKTDMNNRGKGASHAQSIPDLDPPKKVDRKLSEKLHIDGADQPDLIRYVSMQCVRADPTGEGRSRLLDSNSFRAILANANANTNESGSDLIKLLEQNPVPWKVSDYFGDGVYWREILKQDLVFWRHYSIEQALAQPDVTVTDDIRQALAQVDELVNHNEQEVFDFLLAPGDLLIVDNHRCLHSRSAINNPNTPRLMLRSWIE